MCGIVPQQLSDVFDLDEHLEMKRCCRILVARVLDEAEAMEKTETQKEIHLELQLN